MKTFGESKFDEAVEPATNYQLQFANIIPLMDGFIDI